MNWNLSEPDVDSLPVFTIPQSKKHWGKTNPIWVVFIPGAGSYWNPEGKMQNICSVQNILQLCQAVVVLHRGSKLHNLCKQMGSVLRKCNKYFCPTDGLAISRTSKTSIKKIKVRRLARPCKAF